MGYLKNAENGRRPEIGPGRKGFIQGLVSLSDWWQSVMSRDSWSPLRVSAKRV